MTSKNEVAPAQSKALATTNDFDYSQYGQAGFEDVSAKDLSIPFINLLQSNSPIVEQSQEGDGKIKAGMLLNTVTGEVIEGKVGLKYICCHIEHNFTEWVPRTDGGGFVAVHALDSEIVTKAIEANGGSPIPPKGDDGKRINFKNGKNDLIETYLEYALFLNEDGTASAGFGVISFTSTKIKSHKDFITSVYMLRGKPPVFAVKAHLDVKKDTAQGKTFFNYQIKPVNDTWVGSLIAPDDDLIKEAIAFRDMVTSGIARANYDKATPDVDPTQSEKPEKTHVKNDAGEDEEIPF